MPNEEKIFSYHDGSSQRWADPFVVDYKFMKAAESEDIKTLDRWLRDLPRDEDGNIDPDAITPLQERNYTEACFRYVPLVRKAFDLPDFNPETGEGPTASDVMEIWIRYTNWKNGVKKNTESPPTSSTPTDSTPASSPGNPAQWTLKPGTASP